VTAQAERAPLPPNLAAATEHQPRAALATGAALAGHPSHAYLFQGPRGSGKRDVARAFAAELLAAAAAEPEETRRRALLDPSPHPDLVWLRPPGAQHMIDDVRERVIRASAYRPCEGGRRVFVIEAAEALRDESQNALLKTLEEPPAFAHLILLCSEAEVLLETIVSRCEIVTFSPLPPAAIAEALAAEGAAGEGAAAVARLAAGDLERARFLLTSEGGRIRDEAQACASAAIRGDLTGAPWRDLLAGAEAVGEEAEADARERLTEEAEMAGRRSKREIDEGAKRAGRRRRTEVLDLGLELCAAWLRDLAAVAAGASDVVFNSDRREALARDAAGGSQNALMSGVSLVSETRRGLDLNVSEELALEALFFRLESLLGSR
jgi:DNA polymerase-3 subunit delta'